MLSSAEGVRALVASLRLPAVAAPMTGVSTPALVAEACRAGIIGAFPTSNAPSATALDEWFDEIDARIRTTPAAPHPVGPVCANLIVGPQNRRLDADVDTVARRHVPLVITSVGSPAAVIGPLHDAGSLVLADVASRRHADKALEAGADGLVLLSAGAGGHTGWANPFAFARAVRAVYDGPLAVAGGMSDGAALWAATCAGYDLGLVGTRFIATPASGASAAWRQALADATIDDIELRVAANGVATSVIRSGAGSAGHTVGGVEREMTVAEVVDELEAGWTSARHHPRAPRRRRRSDRTVTPAPRPHAGVALSPNLAMVPPMLRSRHVHLRATTDPRPGGRRSDGPVPAVLRPVGWWALLVGAPPATSI